MELAKKYYEDTSEPSVSKITLEYDDGSIREIEKGFICDIKPNKEDVSLSTTFDLVNVSGQELKLIVAAVMEFGMRLGMFGDCKDTETRDDELEE